jgi:hypothetical protein
VIDDGGEGVMVTSGVSWDSQVMAGQEGQLVVALHVLVKVEN